MVTHSEFYALISLFIALISLVVYIIYGGSDNKKD